MRRVGKGAVAAGVVAWVTPEILIATPTSAGAMSSPPNNQNGPPQSSGGGGSAGGSNGQSGSTQPQVAASGNSGSAAPVSAGAQGAGSGGSLPFTGLDLEAEAAAAGALIGGGWLLTRWAARKRNRDPGIEHAGGEARPG